MSKATDREVGALLSERQRILAEKRNIENEMSNIKSEGYVNMRKLSGISGPLEERLRYPCPHVIERIQRRIRQIEDRVGQIKFKVSDHIYIG